MIAEERRIKNEEQSTKNKLRQRKTLLSSGSRNQIGGNRCVGFRRLRPGNVPFHIYNCSRTVPTIFECMVVNRIMHLIKGTEQLSV